MKNYNIKINANGVLVFVRVRAWNTRQAIIKAYEKYYTSLL